MYCDLYLQTPAGQTQQQELKGRQKVTLLSSNIQLFTLSKYLFTCLSLSAAYSTNVE